MKSIQNLLVSFFLAASLTACMVPTPSVTQIPIAPSLPSAETPSAPESTTVVVQFIDPVFKRLILGAMGKPDGEITATEAASVTTIDLSNEWKRQIDESSVITDLRGLESFINLESLDLSFHHITDASPIQGLTNLTMVALGGNPIADLSPFIALNHLKVLVLSDCMAQDYSPLANLVDLELLMLNDSSIADLTPIASLTKLNTLFLAHSPVEDYSPLVQIYPNLKVKDFILPSSLEELGFVMDEPSKQARFDGEEASIRINHEAWGLPAMDGDRNSVWVHSALHDSAKLAVGFYPDLGAYVFQVYMDGEMLMNYVVDQPTSETFSLDQSVGDRQALEQVLNSALNITQAEEVVPALVAIFNDAITDNFNLTATALYKLPFQPITLKSLGFFPDQPNAVCKYEQRGEWDYNIEFHRPEWGEKEFDVRFFTPLSDDYRIVITYTLAEGKYLVSIDDNFQGGASFEFYSDTNEHVDVWCSDKVMTVQECFAKAYNNPEIADIYTHSVQLMDQYFLDRFGMSFQDLYHLASCE